MTKNGKDWNRRVNRPRLTKRVKKPLRSATLIEQRMLGVTAVLRTLPESKLTLASIQEVFGRMIYYNNLLSTTQEIKARPLLRKLIKLNKVDDWTR